MLQQVLMEDLIMRADNPFTTVLLREKFLILSGALCITRAHMAHCTGGGQPAIAENQSAALSAMLGLCV